MILHHRHIILLGLYCWALAFLWRSVDGRSSRKHDTKKHSRSSSRHRSNDNKRLSYPLPSSSQRSLSRHASRSSRRSKSSRKGHVHLRAHIHVNIHVHQAPKPEPCPDSTMEMNCLSCHTKVYRECPVTSASKVTKVYKEEEFDSSNNQCTDGRTDNYGITGNSIWVNYGCRAKFRVCYEKGAVPGVVPHGSQEPREVNCMSQISRTVCSLHLKRSDKLETVSLLWSFGTGRCKEGKTWGYDEESVWVDKGCSATFRILFQ